MEASQAAAVAAAGGSSAEISGSALLAGWLLVAMTRRSCGEGTIAVAAVATVVSVQLVDNFKIAAVADARCCKFVAEVSSILVPGDEYAERGK